MRGRPDLPDYRLHSRHASTISETTERVIKDGNIDSVLNQPVRFEPVYRDPAFSGLVASFLAAHQDKEGPVVIKTSTADLRERNHEPDNDLLDLILSLARDHFPRREIYLADGPAFDANFRAIADHHGWIELANGHGVEVRDLNSESALQLLPDSVFAATLFREAACTISVGKAKTHRRTGISGAEKALVGYLSGDKMGYPKLERRHYLLPAIYAAIQAGAAPMLHVIDGHNAIEGDGPMAGTPTSSDFVLVGEDPTALDIELCLLFQFDPTLVFSVLHPLDRSLVGSDTHQPTVATTLMASSSSMALLADKPVQPPSQQPWLHRSIHRRGSWRNRWAHNRLRTAYRHLLDVE